MPAVNPNDPRAPYVQIADELRAAIKSGRLVAGQKLDSSRELAASYNVAPMTIHQAMRQLRTDGLVVSAQGRGVFVADPSSAPAETGDEALTKAIDELRRDVETLTQRATSDVSTANVVALRDEVAELRKQVGAVQAQLIELYGRVGLPYPQQTTQDTGAVKPARRKASGA